MDILLPNSENEFTDPAYWKRFFQRNSSFEWYGDYTKHSAVFEKYIRPADSILQVGCGNSTLAEGLYDNGYRNVLSIDTDSNVIAKQEKRNSQTRPALKFANCSATEIDLQSGSTNVVIDKGTLDALFPPKYTDQDEEVVNGMFKEIERCLAPFGRYIIVTLAQRHIIDKLLDFFGRNQFLIRVQKSEYAEKDFILPAFVVIITKFKTALEQRRKFEFLTGIDSPAESVDSVEKLCELIKAQQQMNWFRHYISRGPVEETSVKISSKDGDERYELFIVDDLSLKSLCKYGVFVVPSGRERDWIFATPKGRSILRKNCELHRVVVVRLSRLQDYGSIAQIQSELDPVILDFMPRACAPGQDIKYLSLGKTDVSENIETGDSAISGKWSVEHVLVNEAMYRRLVFLDSTNLVQSEAQVKRNKKDNLQIDWSTKPLCCEHHQNMLLALELLCNAEGRIGAKNLSQRECRFAVLGLGGGILAKVLHDTFQKSKVVGVELDREVLEIAIKHFDFPESAERLKVEICDAYEFLQKTAASEAEEKFDVILVDLSGPANDQGLYCPSPQFVTEEALILMRNSLKPYGILTLNLVTRDDEVAEEVKKRFQHIFTTAYYIKGDEDINEVLFGSCNSNILPMQAEKKRKKRTTRKTSNSPHNWLDSCLEEVEKICDLSIN